MTIITQPPSEKKLAKQKEPLVKYEFPLAGDVEDPRPMVVTMHARRVGSITTMCVFVASLLVLSTGIIGGIYLYRQLTQYRLHHFKGWCTIPYTEEQQSGPPLTSKLLQPADQRLQSSYQSLFQNNPLPQEYFREELDIDIESEKYARIEVPDFDHGRHGRFIHDFVKNITGIIDFKGKRCFVMPLNRTLVLPPRNLFDLILKMKMGYYDVDTRIVRATMQIAYPPLTDLKPLGQHISRECATRTTYMLEKAPDSHQVYKRSAEGHHGSSKETPFVAFSGHMINEVYILDLDKLDN